MTTFVLVHGAWHGGWCWRDVAAALRSYGHEVFTPTLTGLGEREHLASPEVNLSTHIRDVVNVFRFEDLSDVRLVGHSYGGVVISGVAEALSDRIGHLVYLDAIVPTDGKRQIDMVPRRPGGAAEQFEKAQGAEALPIASMEFLGVAKPEQIAWLEQKLRPHPMGTLVEPINLPTDRVSGLPRTFIRCTEPVDKPMSPFAVKVKEDAGWRYRELATGHDAMVTAPDAVVELLLEVA